jgi:hypothetical protein
MRVHLPEKDKIKNKKNEKKISIYRSISIRIRKLSKNNSMVVLC